MKKFLGWVLVLSEAVAALVFLLNAQSDIQLGFGLTFVFLGWLTALMLVW